MPTEKMSPERIKHLEFIQGVITRMNNNSFQMKGWMVAIMALYISQGIAISCLLRSCRRLGI